MFMFRLLKAKLKKRKRRNARKLSLPPCQTSWHEHSDRPSDHGPTTSKPVGEEHQHLHAKLKDDLDSQVRIQDELLTDLRMKRQNVLHSSIKIEPINVSEERELLEKAKDGFQEHEDRIPMLVNHNDIRGDWPRRLLHVPTMTSFEWRPGNVYGTYVEPCYIAISYTWGRWRISDAKLAVEAVPSPSLPVSGIHWRIPPVEESLFSAKQFEMMLRRATTHCQMDFVWLDVACIDQTRNSKDGADEIGRQAKIFGHASQAFVWLLTPADKRASSAPSLKEILKILNESSEAASRSRITLEEMDGDIQWFMAAAGATSHLTDIPWWTSLWTLQEAFMRPDAIILDNEGKVVSGDNGNRLETLSNILRLVAGMYSPIGTLGWSTRTEADQDIEYFIAKHGFIRVVDRSGLYALGMQNPLLLYTCAKARQTRRPLDRIYGIMQIWGFRLGKAAQNAVVTDDGRTLEDLELELGIELIRQFPIESQLFVHGKSIANRQAWRVSNHSTVPAFVVSLNFEKGHLTRKLASHSAALGVRSAYGIEYGTFSGKAIDFRIFVAAILNATKSHIPVTIFGLALDENPVFNAGTLQSRCSTQDIPVGKHKDIMMLVSAKASEFQRRLVVGLLTVLEGDNDKSCTTVLGMILMEVADGQIARWWKRIGICLWTVPTTASLQEEDGSMRTAGDLDVESNSWFEVEALFG